MNKVGQKESPAAFLASIVESFEDSIVTIDRDNLITSWNRGAELLYGYSAEEVLGSPITLVMVEKDLEPVLDKMCRARHGERIAAFESERVRKDGTQIAVSIKLSPIKDHQGTIIGVASLSRDITEQKSDREALRRSEEQFRLLTESIPQLVWTCSPDGICDYISPQWGRYTGIPSEQQLGRKWLEAVHPDDREQMHHRWEAAVRCEEPFDLEYRLRNAEGEYRWFAVRGAPVKNEQGRIVKWFGTCTDIELRKRAEIQLESLVAKRTADLRQTVKQLEAFSYSMAHDMRAPLRAMSSFAHILHDRYGLALDKQGLEMTERIYAAAERLDSLIVDVLSYTRVVREKARLAPVDLQRLVTELIASSPDWSGPRGTVRIIGPLPAVIGHIGFLTQCISNLVENGLKFVTPGARPEVLISAETHGHRVRIKVSDNGIGIAPADQERIFRMFERLRPSKEYPGTGMGLAIVRTAVERMGGRVGVESEAGRGSTFWIELRRAEAEKALAA